MPIDQFDGPTDNNWTCPLYVTEVFVEAWGTGGDGFGGAPGGDAGGGGAYAGKVLTVVPGVSYPVKIDGAGARFLDGFIDLVKAALGGPGTDIAPGVGGQIADCIGTYKHKGGDGGSGDGDYGGGGGGAAGQTNDGGDGGDGDSGTTTPGAAGLGGAGITVAGGDGGIGGDNGSAPGDDGVAPGGGGGGSGGVGETSGVGGFGRVMISYEFGPVTPEQIDGVSDVIAPVLPLAPEQIDDQGDVLPPVVVLVPSGTADGIGDVIAVNLPVIPSEADDKGDVVAVTIGDQPPAPPVIPAELSAVSDVSIRNMPVAVYLPSISKGFARALNNREGSEKPVTRPRLRR